MQITSAVNSPIRIADVSYRGPVGQLFADQSVEPKIYPSMNAAIEAAKLLTSEPNSAPVLVSHATQSHEALITPLLFLREGQAHMEDHFSTAAMYYTPFDTPLFPEATIVEAGQYVRPLYS